MVSWRFRGAILWNANGDTAFDLELLNGSSITMVYSSRGWYCFKMDLLGCLLIFYWSSLLLFPIFTFVKCRICLRCVSAEQMPVVLLSRSSVVMISYS